VLVVGNTGWRAGILGLVAGKLTDEFGIPSFVWGMEEGDDNVKGSCRSDGSVNVVELMTVASDHLVSFGGHSGAGGFVATKERIHFLEEALSLAYEQVKTEKEIKKEVALAVLPLKEVNRAVIKQISECAPFGLENPKPIFLFQNVLIKKVKLFGKEGEHLELTLEDESGSSLAVAFFKKPSDYVKVPEEGGTITLAGVLEMSYFAGRTTTRIRIIDIF
jgi:single-stranded-DNA-specific exonuclease